MSFITLTPWSIAKDAVSALYVSIDIGIFVLFITAGNIFFNLSISSFLSTRSAPGREDSAPMSRKSAPSSSIFCAILSTVSLVV
ncbi:hypothetical protein ES705_21425 [subsurface metagenome]